MLTFDSDHMTEELMEQFVERYPDLPESVFFVTQRYKSLEKTNHKICPHPLQPTLDMLRNLQEEIAQPKMGVRFHSCWWSHKLMEMLAMEGYIWSSNIFYPWKLEPYIVFGVAEIPYQWMDNLAFSENKSVCWFKPGKKECVAFHPIHILLNSESTGQLKGFREIGDLTPYPGYGVRNKFEEYLARSN